jgi:ribosomal protein L12E/L44/L45/RPP1/RPP2
MPPRSLASTLLVIALLGGASAQDRIAAAEARVTQDGGEPVPAQDPSPEVRAATLRAMVILKLAPYLTTEQKPAEVDGKRVYRIGIVGSDQVATVAAQALPGKKVDELVVVVVPVSVASASAAADEDHARAYDVLYVAGSVSNEVLPKIVAAHGKEPVPLICERPGFAQAGGGIQLFVQDNHLRFEINAEALRKQGVKTSPQLLKLSREGPR